MRLAGLGLGLEVRACWGAGTVQTRRLASRCGCHKLRISTPAAFSSLLNNTLGSYLDCIPNVGIRVGSLDRRETTIAQNLQLPRLMDSGRDDNLMDAYSCLRLLVEDMIPEDSLLVLKGFNQIVSIFCG